MHVWRKKENEKGYGKERIYVWMPVRVFHELYYRTVCSCQDLCYVFYFRVMLDMLKLRNKEQIGREQENFRMRKIENVN